MTSRGSAHASTRPVDERIEFLAPNDAAFGMAGIADFVGFDGDDEPMFGDEGPRSKWLPAAATVVVLALLGGGVIAAAPWDDIGQATPAPSTTVTPTTTPENTPVSTRQVPTTTDRVLGIDQVGPAGYVLDDAGTFVLAGAWVAGVEFRPSEAYADDWFDLWTSPDATRTTGQWLAVTTSKARGDYDETLPNGTRVVVGHGIGVVSTTADGVARLLFTTTDGTPFEIGGFGFGLGQLLTVVAQVDSLPDDTIDYGSLPDGILAGLTPRVSAHVPNGGLNPFLLMAQRRGGADYVDPVSGASVELAVSQPTEVDAAVIDFLFQPVTTANADEQAFPLVVLTRDGLRFRLSSLPDFPDTIVATSVRPGDDLMLDTIGVQAAGSLTVWGSNMTVPSMMRVLTQVRLASDDEWVDAIDRSNQGLLNVGDSSTSPPVVIGLQDPSGPDDNWYRFEMTPDPSYLFVSSRSSGWGGPMADIPPGTTAPTVHRYASASATFLVGTVGWKSPIRQMRVTLDGQAPVDIPMVPVGKAVYAAGYAFNEMLPDTVEFLDDNGNVVAV